MKSFMFDGRIGAKGAEVFTTRGGKQYVRFSVANNSFVGGKDKTEWYDVTSYDPFVIEKRVQYLTKGTYVIISGSLNTEVKVSKDNNIWLNNYVTANTIDTPSFKKKEGEDDAASVTTNSEPAMSTFTAGTRSDISTAQAAPVSEPTPMVSPVAAAVMDFGAGDASDDDLPF